MGLLHLGGGILQNLQVLQGTRRHWISAEFRLQKYPAKARLNARIFAKPAVKIGYARVSTQDQNLDLQLTALKKAGCQKIFREKVPGSNRHRPEFERMLD